MTVIILTQEIGSRSNEVAAAIAEQLGLEVVQREWLEQCVATRFGINDGVVRRLIEGDASLIERLKFDAHRLSRYLADEIVRLAARDNVVIVARGAVAQLRPINHVLRVHICASCRAVACTDPLDRGNDSGTTLKARWPRVRPALLGRALLGVDRESREHYDLVLNTEQTSVTECAGQIGQLAQSPEFQATAASRAMLAGLLEEACLRSEAVSGWVGNSATSLLEVDLGSHSLKLAGFVSSEQVIAHIEDHLRGRNACVIAQGPSLPPPRGIL